MLIHFPFAKLNFLYLLCIYLKALQRDESHAEWTIIFVFQTNLFAALSDYVYTLLTVEKV